MAEQRPDIPEPMKREIRQRCGFGCVICGLPIYDYEHMQGWASVLRHDADDITLLCVQHHREKTNGLLTLEQVRRANACPVNLSRGISAPYGLHFELDDSKSVNAFIGGNRFSSSLQADTSFIAVDDTDLVWTRVGPHGRVELYLNIFDEFNNLALNVAANELQFASSVWDITFEGRTLILREAPRQLLLEISFLPPNTIRIDRGNLLCNGVEIIVTPDLVYCDGRQLIRSIGRDNQAGLVVGRNLRGIAGAFAWSDIPRQSPQQRNANKQGALRAGAQSRSGVDSAVS